MCVAQLSHHSSASGHPGCFHVLAFVNSAQLPLVEATTPHSSEPQDPGGALPPRLCRAVGTPPRPPCVGPSAPGHTLGPGRCPGPFSPTPRGGSSRLRPTATLSVLTPPLPAPPQGVEPTLHPSAQPQHPPLFLPHHQPAGLCARPPAPPPMGTRAGPFRLPPPPTILLKPPLPIGQSPKSVPGR